MISFKVTWRRYHGTGTHLKQNKYKDYHNNVV
jgi:hypothetical protein